MGSKMDTWQVGEGSDSLAVIPTQLIAIANPTTGWKCGGFY